MFTDQKETMARGDQEFLLIPMNQMWTMCLMGDQSKFGPIGNRRWKHKKEPNPLWSQALVEVVD